MAKNAKGDGGAADAGKGEGGADAMMGELDREVRAWVRTTFREECTKHIADKRDFDMALGSLCQKTFSKWLENATTFNDKDKAYLRPHVRGIAASVCGNCNGDTISAEMLEDEAVPWIEKEKAHAVELLKRFNERQKSSEADQVEEIEVKILTKYCEGFGE